MNAVLDLLDVFYERVEDAYLVRVGELHVYLFPGEQDVRVEAFVMHVLPSSSPGLPAWLLRANLTMRSVHFAVDDVGDVFLVGSLSLRDVTPQGVDRLLGEIASIDRSRVLAAGYGSAVPEKALLDGAGRRPAGVPGPRRDARR